MIASRVDRLAPPTVSPRQPSRPKVLEEFITCAQSHPGVAFMRKDKIVRFASVSPLTVREGIF